MFPVWILFDLRMMEVAVTKLQSNRHHQQNYHPTNSVRALKWKKVNKFHRLVHPKLTWGSSNLVWSLLYRTEDFTIHWPSWAPAAFFPGRANGEPRPEGPRQGGVLGRAYEPPPHQLGGLGWAISSPSGVRGRAPAQIIFVQFLTSKWPLAATIFAPYICPYL